MRRNWITILPLVLLFGITNYSTAEEVKKKIYTGRVIDYNALPVADATVVCYKYDYDFNQRSYEHLKQVKTTSDGRFSLQVEQRDFSSTYLVAGKQGLALGWRETYNIKDHIIRLGRPSQFKGIVVDPAGHPVSGAKVRICLKNKMITRREIAPLLPEKWFTTKTDVDGRFLFNNVPVGATADFGVEAPGRASIWTTCDFGPGQGEQFTAGRTDIRIVLPPEACIKGKVVEQETGEPVAGVKILARPKSHPNWQHYQDKVYSDLNGKFVITGLAPGKYFLQAMSDKKGAGNLTVAVELGQTISDIIVSLKGCPLEVIVYDAEKGGTIEDAYVTVTQKEATTKYTTFRQQLTTDTDGLARFSVPSGECEVEVIKPDYGAIFQSQRVQLEVGQKTRHEVSLPRTAIVLSGEVSDEQGNAISDALVMHQSFGYRFSTLTDVNGHFDTNDIHFHSSRLPSSVRVLAQHIQSGLGAVGVLRDPTRTGKPHGRIILKPAYVLTGSVTDPNGRNIPAAYVKLLTGSSSEIVTEVTTDTNGVYSIRSVPPVGENLTYVIVAYAEGFGQTAAKRITFHNDTARPVHLESIVLQPADQAISGVVEDANNQAVTGVSVWVRGPEIITNYRQIDYGETLTDEQGRFRITGVCKEPLHIFASSPSAQRLTGQTWANGGNENVKVVLGQNLIFSPSLIGKPLPELKDLKVDLSPANVSDKMLLVCFWDMEQRPSRNCIMRLARQAEQLKQKGVAVVAIQASKIDENKLNDWVKKYKIPFAVGIVQGDVEKTRFTWGVKSLPWLILTNSQHIIHAEDFSLTELDEKISAIAQKQN
jgi:hypothetical protein